MAPKTEVIEQLRARIAELEEEIERLKSAIPVHTKKESECDTKDDWRQKAMYYESCWSECSYGFNKVAGELRAQLAAEQLNNKLLRKALEAVIKVHGYESGIPVEAISTRASTEALDKYVAEKVKEYKEDMEAMAGLSHNNFEYVTELTRQRDLAVDELEKAASYHESHECYAEAKRVRAMLSAIKESEK